MSRGVWSQGLKSVARHGRRVAGSRWFQLAVVFGLCIAPNAQAIDLLDDVVGQVNRVEEDWEIVVGEPSEDEILPQLYVVTSPSGTTDGRYSVLEINNLLLPDFYGGGLQLQTWAGNVPTGEAHHDSFKSLATNGETITFTVSLRVNEGNMQVEILNGNSTTWGSFGGSSLKLTQPSDVSDLGSYGPEKSAKFSRVGSGRGRVTQFRIKKTRYYHNDNLKWTDNTARDAQVDEPT